MGLATAGQLAASYALTFAIAGPPIATLTARVDRRLLLALGLGLVALLNLATALVLPAVAAFMLVPVAPLVQARLMGLAPQDRSVALALNGAFILGGQGGGAAYGGAVIAAAGLAWAGLAGAVLALAGAALALRAYRAPR